MPEALDVSTRDDMLEYFSRHMSQQVGQFMEEHELLPGRGLLKTYVLEADQGIYATSDPVEQVDLALRGRVRGIESVERLRDNASLARLVWKDRGDDGTRTHVFFLDMTHPRMWRLYSDSPSDAADRFWQKLRGVAFLDSTWLPKQFFTRLHESSIGTLTGITSKFAKRLLGPEEDADRPSLSMKVWGTKSPQALGVLNGSSEMSDSFTLTGVRLRYFLANTQDSALDDVAFDGKVTSWGRGIDAHEQLLSRIFDQQYLNLLEEVLESRFRFAVSAQGDATGEPAYIVLSHPVDSVATFVRDLFSSKLTAFRLTGIEDVMGDEFARVLTLDKHVGRSLAFEMSREKVRILLPADGCGNTILRILTLIQQEYDPGAVLVDSDDVRIIS